MVEISFGAQYDRFVRDQATRLGMTPEDYLAALNTRKPQAPAMGGGAPIVPDINPDGTPWVQKTYPEAAREFTGGLFRGIVEAPGVVADYVTSRPPKQIVQDVVGVGKGMIDQAREDPANFVAGLLPVTGDAQSGAASADTIAKAREMEASGDLEGARKLYGLAGLMGGMTLLGMAGMTKNAGREGVEAALRGALPDASSLVSKGASVADDALGAATQAPTRSVTAYKLFRRGPDDQLYPLFVDAKTPVEVGQWLEAKAGPPGKTAGRVGSSIGDLAYRPGWHAGDLPIATHIGGKSQPGLSAPDYRPDDQVWAEVQLADDVDWQSVANSRATTSKSGKVIPRTAQITDQVPLGGHYRYKTNPNMTGEWLIGGNMKVVRLLPDDEVAAINAARGVSDLPRRTERGAADAAQMMLKDTNVADQSLLTGAFAKNTTPVRGNTSAELMDMWAKTATPKELDLVAKYSAQYPDFGRAVQFMVPEEIRATIRSPQGPVAVQKLLDYLPQAEEYAALAKMGSAKQGWYRASTNSIIDVFGRQDAPRFTALLAGTSPQTSVESNLRNSLNIWANWNAAGRPTDPGAILEIMGRSVEGEKGMESVLDAWKNNVVTALSSSDPLGTILSGPKVDSFMRNLGDDVYRVTNDAWMANGAGLDQNLLRGTPRIEKGDPGFTPAYASMSARQREGGQMIGMYPDEVQESGWSVLKSLLDNAKASGRKPTELLDSGDLTAEMIRGTPDFSTLFHVPEYQQILERAGYGQQLANLKPFEWGDAVIPDMSPAELGHVRRAAERLDKLMQRRSVERARTVYPDITPPRQGWADLNYEAVSGFAGGNVYDSSREYIGEAVDMAGWPEGKRANWTSAIRGADKTLAGRSSLMDAYFQDDALDPIPNQGVWKPDGGDVQYNPGTTLGTRLDLTADGNLYEYDRHKLRSAASLLGGINSQDAVGYTVMMPSRTGKSVVYPTGSKLRQDNLEQVVDLLGQDRALIDNGRWATTLDMGAGAPGREMREQVQGLLSYGSEKKAENPSKYFRATNKGDYFDFTEKWKAGPGSREMTKTMLDDAARLRPADYARVNEGVKPMARAAFEKYSRLAQSMPVRKDFLNMLEAISKNGLKGLKAAYNNPQISLPAIIGAIWVGEQGAAPEDGA